MLSYGFKQAICYPSLFLKQTKDSFTALLVYIDDVILTRTDLKVIQQIKSFLREAFQIKTLGPLKFFMALEVARYSKGINVCKRKYVIDILQDFCFLGGEHVSTLVDCSS